MKVTTKTAKQTWQSPDKQRTIWEVTISDGDKDYGLKTYSEEIAQVGFQGDVETYVNNRGDRFVRQVPKEKASYGGKGGGNYQPRDDAGIKAQFAIKAAIAFCPKPENARDMEAISAIEDVAMHFYAMVDRVKGHDPVEAVMLNEYAKPARDTVHEPTPEELNALERR